MAASALSLTRAEAALWLASSGKDAYLFPASKTLVDVAKDLPLACREGGDLAGSHLDQPLPLPGMILDFLYDEDKLIQRRVDYLRVVPTNANPGRFG